MKFVQGQEIEVYRVNKKKPWYRRKWQSSWDGCQFAPRGYTRLGCLLKAYRWRTSWYWPSRLVDRLVWRLDPFGEAHGWRGLLSSEDRRALLKFLVALVWLALVVLVVGGVLAVVVRYDILPEFIAGALFTFLVLSVYGGDL